MKKWYQSKTLWVNAIAFVALFLQIVTGKQVISVETQAIILTVVNFVLRIVTKDKIGIVDDTKV